MPESAVTFSVQQQKEIEEAYQQLERRQEFHNVIFKFTDICFKKCVPSPGASLEKSEKACLGHCVERFMDASFMLADRLDELGKRSQPA